MKKGHWNYEKDQVVTLREMKEGEVLFDIRAMAEIEETEFVIEDGQSYTQGTYRVTDICRAPAGRGVGS